MKEGVFFSSEIDVFDGKWTALKEKKGKYKGKECLLTPTL